MPVMAGFSVTGPPYVAPVPDAGARAQSPDSCGPRRRAAWRFTPTVEHPA